MQFNYSKNHLKDDLIWGLVQLGIGLANILTHTMGTFFQYTWLLMGILSLLKNHQERRVPYLKIENEILFVHSIFGYKKIHISDFNEIELKRNSIFLKNNNKQKQIWTWLAEANTQELLSTEITKIFSTRI